LLSELLTSEIFLHITTSTRKTNQPPPGGFFMPGARMFAVLLLTFLSLPARPDPRCNTAARYEAMAAGADCFHPPKFPKPKHKERK
jgi:hypothetical protein